MGNAVSKEEAMRHPRHVAWDRIEGVFRLPIGVRLFEHDPYEGEPAVIVSTVQLDGAHMESMIPGMMEPETGYETMVFFEATTLFGLYNAHYKTKRAARAGHDAVVKKLLDRSLPLSLAVHYWAREPSPL